MTPTPIRQVLSTFQKSGVRTLLMGGQACVFYGAAQVSKDIDFLVLAEAENFARLQAALETLQADRIAVPPFDPAALARGHAVHFRCRAPGAAGLRVDVMTRLRAMPEITSLWDRRTTLVDDEGVEYHLLCIPDLVQAKKTQRSKDWPVIELLVTIHDRQHAGEATDEQVDFWLHEARTPELLVELCRRLPTPKCHWPTYPLSMSPLTKSLIEELEHAPESVPREVLAFLRHRRARGVGSDGSEDVHALLPLAESAWAADWDTPEEDEAWRM